MPDLTINGMTYHAKEVFRIAQGKELDAVNAARRDEFERDLLAQDREPRGSAGTCWQDPPAP